MQKLLEQRKGDVCYVCAAGASVNLLPEEIVLDMSLNTVIGINGWCAHSVVPDIFILETHAQTTRHDDNIQTIYKNLNDKASQYSKVPIVIKDIEDNGIDFELFPPALLPNVISCNTRLISGSSRAEIAQTLIQDRIARRLETDFNRGILPKRRGTVVFALILAYLMGFGCVRMIGADIVSRRHFYEPATVENVKEAHLCEFAGYGIPISQVILGVYDALFYSTGRSLKAFMPCSLFKGEIGEF